MHIHTYIQWSTYTDTDRLTTKYILLAKCVAFWGKKKHTKERILRIGGLRRE